MNDLKLYPFALAKNNTYITGNSKSNFSFLSSVRFYPKLASVVFKSSNRAKKGLYDSVRWAESSFKIFRALEKSGVKFQINGMDNLSKFEGPAVFISNHMSTLETMILPGLIQPVREVTFIVKQELIDYPIFGWVLKARNPIVVGRSNPREDLSHVLIEGNRLFKEGRSLVIFPQRTRSNIFDSESFNSLGVKLAKRAGVYVVPVALSTDAWGNGKIIKDFGKIDPNKTVHFEFGEPFKIESNGTTEHEKIISFIRSRLLQWGRTDCVKD